MSFIGRRDFLKLAVIGSATSISEFSLKSFTNEQEGDWPMESFDAANTGYSTGISGPNDLTEDWKYETDHEIHSSPVVSNGIVYIGSDDRNIYALDSDTGDSLWNFEVGEAIEESSPAVLGDKIFIASPGDKVYALDKSSGEKQWSRDVGLARRNIVASDSAVVYTVPNHLIARDTDTGEELWRFSTYNSGYSSPAIHDSSVYFGATDETLYSIDLSTGNEEWTFRPFGWIVSSPAADDNSVYFGTNDDLFYAIDADDGSERWNIDIGNTVRNSPAVTEDKLIVAAGNEVLALSKEDGSEEWTARPGRSWTASPCVVGSTVYAVGGNTLYAFDLESGDEKSQFNTGGSIRESSPAVSGNRVFIGSEDNSIYALSEPVLFDINISVEGEGTTDPEPRTHEYVKEEEVNLEVIPETGWKFIRWSGDIENQNQEIEITVEEDLDVIAEFGRREHELSIMTEGEGTTNPKEGQYTYEFGEEVEVEAIPNGGWAFMGWSGDVQSAQSPMSVTIEGDRELIAEFERQEFEVEISVEGEGATQPEENLHTYEYGEEVDIEAISEAGWVFVRWSGDVETDQETISVIIEEDMILTAHFEKVEDPPGDDEPTDDLEYDVDDLGEDSDDEPDDDDTIPGFGIGAAVVGIGTAGYVLKQRLLRSEKD